jgi:hypothetical protein
MGHFFAFLGSRRKKYLLKPFFLAKFLHNIQKFMITQNLFNTFWRIFFENLAFFPLENFDPFETSYGKNSAFLYFS